MTSKNNSIAQSEMKILLIGADSPYAIEKFYLEHLLKYGGKVDTFYAQNIFLAYYQKSFLNKVLYRVGLSSILGTINSKLIDFFEQSKPDIIFIFKGMELKPSTLEYFKKAGIKLANYNPDNPFIFSGRGSGNKNITKSLHLYDLHFTYNLAIQQQLRNRFNKPVELLPFAYDVSDSTFQQCIEEKEIIKTCFLGNPDKPRAAFITKLAALGVAIDVYGHGWKKWVNHKNITVFDAVYDLEQWKTLRKYRVQLNLMRIHNLDSHNMRTFEIPGIGGIQLAPDTTEHRLFFDDEKNIFLYNNELDCSQKIKMLLDLDKKKAIEIRESARNTCKVNKHTYADRAAFVLDCFQRYFE